MPQVNHQLHESLATINGKSFNDNVLQNDISVNSYSKQDKPKYSLKEEAKKYSYNYFVNKPDMSVTNIIDGVIISQIIQGKRSRSLQLTAEITQHQKIVIQTFILNQALKLRYLTAIRIKTQKGMDCVPIRLDNLL